MKSKPRNTTGPRPHSALLYWTPDQVAECIEGISPRLYTVLWELAVQRPRPANMETPDELFPMALGRSWYWNQLSAEQKVEINAVVKRHKDAEDAAYERYVAERTCAPPPPARRG